MKISICIPQYNRIDYLLLSLEFIKNQTYKNIEIVISDDCSTDDTETRILEYKKEYCYNIKYFRFDKNVGYDKNTRNALELATGDYCIALGNDDTFNDNFDIEYLCNFLIENNFPEIGFCNTVDYWNANKIQARCKENRVVGTGKDIALKYYSSFSFISGIIIKKSMFNIINSEKADKSIYFQLYMGVCAILNNGRLFTIVNPMIRSNIRLNGQIANSYLDTLPRNWSQFKVLDGGLPQFAFVTMLAFKDCGYNIGTIYYKIIYRIYTRTYPYWLLNYRSNGSFVGAIGLILGLKLKSFKEYINIPVYYRLKLIGLKLIFSIMGILTPIFIFNLFKSKLYLSGK